MKSMADANNITNLTLTFFTSLVAKLALIECMLPDCFVNKNIPVLRV